MATLDQIDITKSLRFCGNSMKISNDPELVGLAAKLDNPQLLNISESIINDVFLEAKDTQVLLAYIRGSIWRKDFESNLQCMTEIDDMLLLTCWFGIDRFLQFVNQAGEDVFAVHNILNKLKTSTAEWKNAGVELVYIDGYKCP